MPTKRRVEDELITNNAKSAKKPRIERSNIDIITTSNGHDESIPDVSGADKEEHEELFESGVVEALDEDMRAVNELHTDLQEDSNDEDDEYNDEAEDENMDNQPQKQKQKHPIEGFQDLYLDTINRKALDFDFEKLCSVTLSNINIYACLVCGKYFQGRGLKSQAYFHSLDIDHHVFINLETKKIYVLPEGYEVNSTSLDDIKFVVDPKLSKDNVLALDRPLKQNDLNESLDLEGKKYIPGFIGMNNIKANDYLNVIIQALSHVPPLRNFLLLEDLSSKSQLVQRFSLLVRKMWNPRAFKAHISPHELLQQVALQSNKSFGLTVQSDPIEFASWFLNSLHLALGGSRTKPKSSIIQSVFQGFIQIESQTVTAARSAGDRLRFDDSEVATTKTPFTFLTLDLPPAPLFHDNPEEAAIPQIPLITLLGKYNGVTTQEAQNTRRRHRLLHPLPPYLLIHIKRFVTKRAGGTNVVERNPTIVTFNPKGLDLSPYIAPDTTGKFNMTDDYVYDLIANVTHEAIRERDDSVEGEAERKVWRISLIDRKSIPPKWLEMQDLFVENVDGETLFTRESYLMIWERRRSNSDKKSK